MKECSTLNTSLWCGWGQRSCCFLEYSVKNVGNYLWHLENWPWHIQQADKNKLLPACPDRVDNQMSTWCLHSKHQIKRTLRRGSWRGCRQSEWWSPELLLLCALPLRNCIPHQYNTSLLSGADFCSPNKWHCSLKTRLAYKCRCKTAPWLYPAKNQGSRDKRDPLMDCGLLLYFHSKGIK